MQDFQFLSILVAILTAIGAAFGAFYQVKTSTEVNAASIAIIQRTIEQQEIERNGDIVKILHSVQDTNARIDEVLHERKNG